MKIINVVGARPNFIKIAPLLEEYKKWPKIKSLLVHTGQHYDFNMSQRFFDELKISKPDYNLGIGSGSHAQQTARIMLSFEKVCIKEKPDLVVVVGDVNSTVACALVAKKMNINVAHVEAGLRSFDESMPEEINRILTDHLSDFLFVTEESGKKNLQNENIPPKKIFFVGNIMIDSLVKNLREINNRKIIENLNLNKKDYLVITFHRPSNVENKEILSKLLGYIKDLSKDMVIVFPIHPRTKKALEDYKLKEIGGYLKNIKVTEPLGYLDFISLVKNSKGVLTDSGGVQEETTFLGVPCITLRENTERPITIKRGTNHLISNIHEEGVLEKIKNLIENFKPRVKNPEKWDGKTAERILKVIVKSASEES
ncbi:UDP-N-acetylglucosamine 2-epimerase (non-hydrolyzing) [Patescibacteria group bacterium]|nr:UDP-N-acetylglucosamine 2-epimerase (non-hydrolyzing) [Patescibacteria group bacterium]